MPTSINLGKIRPVDKGEWSSTYEGGYDILDIVTSGKGSYMSKVKPNTFALTDRTKWIPLVDSAAIELAIQEAMDAAAEADAARLAIQNDLAAKSGESEEDAIASVINALKNEIKALKDLIAKGEYSTIQAGIIDIQEDLKLKGSTLIYVGTTPPAFAPDQVPQFYVDITAKKLYTASGTANAGSWF